MEKNTTDFMTATEVCDAHAQTRQTFIVERVTTQGIWDEDGRLVRDEQTTTVLHISATSPLDALHRAIGMEGRFPSLIPGKWRVVGIRGW